MSQAIRSCFAQSFTLTTATTWTVTDQGGVGRTVTFNPGPATLWCRHWLASGGSGTGATEETPFVFSAYVESRLNSGLGGTKWHIRPTLDGFVEIYYTGTGTASVTAIDAVVAPLLGITATFSGLTNGGSTFTAPRHPTHVLYAASRIDDTDWVPRPPTIGGVEIDDGTVDILSSGITGMERAFTFFGHPRTWAIRSSRGSSITPMYSDEAYWKTQHLDTPGIAPPWSVQRFMMSSAGRRVSAYFAWHLLIPYILTGTGTVPPLSFYEIMWNLETLRNANPVRPTRPYFEELLNWGPVRARFTNYVAL